MIRFSGLIFILLSTLLFVSPQWAKGQGNPQKINSEFFDHSVNLIRKYFFKEPSWHVTNSETTNKIKGLIDFIENEPIDTTINTLRGNLSDPFFNFVYRLPEKVSDSLSVPGFYPHSKLETEMKRVEAKVKTDVRKKNISLPDHFFENIEKKAGIIPAGEGYKLFTGRIYKLPDSLVIQEVIPDSLLLDHNAFQRLLRLENLRKEYIENKRRTYNDSVVEVYRDSVTTAFRNELILNEFNLRRKALNDSVTLNNYQVLRQYNDEKIRQVNDSIAFVLNVLTEYANFIDSVKLKISNIANQTEDLTLNAQANNFSRIWLKNAQNDSISLLIRNIDKRSLQMFIDDGAIISRFTEKPTKEFDFSTLNRRKTEIKKVTKSYELLTPWRIGGNGTIGFTQTYLENWKKGGKSALSQMVVLKGFANYSQPEGKLKWENSGEFRNGWIRQGGAGAELQKNDDKLEITSRFGIITATNSKWYYSAEFNFETQTFNGYIYPKSKNPKPISSFMAPSRTFFKIGLDYKPSKYFSMLLSPLTLKNVFVRDTAKVDPTKYGIAKGKNKFWDPGLNADLTFKKDLTKDFTWESRYRMFINYKAPFKKYDVNWENLMILRLNRFIDMRFMLHMIYDDDVLFPVYNEANVKIGDKPKLQLMQLTTIGFSYKINKQVQHTRKLR